MRNLYDQDFYDPTYTDSRLLADIRALVQSGQREGTKLDYKQDISETDNWVETVAAFANSYGGLIIFGVETGHDIPRAVVGFSSSVEVQTKLTSQIISRIQPVPEFSVRIAALDTDVNKQVAVVRVAEGWNTPYMYSRGDNHRVYVRSEARKAEADYLQLMRLFEKRKMAGRTDEAINQEFLLYRDWVHPRAPRRATPHTEVAQWPPSLNLYRTTVVPRLPITAPLDLRVEKAFGHSFEQAFQEDIIRAGAPGAHAHEWTRTVWLSAVSYFTTTVASIPHFERRWALGRSGVIVFASESRHDAAPGGRPSFVLVDFVHDLVCGISLAHLYYRAMKYYGAADLFVDLAFEDETYIEASPVLCGYNWGPISELFVPPGDTLLLRGHSAAKYPMELQPLTRERIVLAVTDVVNQLVRHFGATLHPERFQQRILPIAAEGVGRAQSAPSVTTS